MAQETVYGVWYYADIDGRNGFGALTVDQFDEDFPQGLKPGNPSVKRIGTTEVVPFQSNRSLDWPAL